jgi:hypothetical protein
MGIQATKTKTLALVLAVLYIVAGFSQLALVPSIAVAMAQGERQVANETSDNVYQVLLTKANVLRQILSGCLSLNISDDLKSNISDLLSVNISSLSFDELRSWVEEGSKLLLEVNEEVRVGGRAYAVGVRERYLNGFKKAIENRLRLMERRYGLNVSDVVWNVTRARDIKEVREALKELEKGLTARKAIGFADTVLNISAKEVARGIPKAIEKIGDHLTKTLDVLNMVIQRLISVNASQQAIEALEHASAKISEARNITLSVLRQVAVEPRDIPKIVRGVAENRSAEIVEEIEELLEELRNLREVALARNLTDVVNKIDLFIQRLEELKQRAGNLSIDDIARWMPDIVEIKAWMKMIRSRVSYIPKAIPVKDIDNIYNASIRKAEKLLEEVENMLEYVRNKSKEIICIMVYPPPPACAFLDKGFMEGIELLIDKSKELINNAKELYGNGRKFEAFSLANRAVAMLQIAKARLEPIYNMVKAHIERGRETEVERHLEVKEARISRVKGFVYRLSIRVRNTGEESIAINRIIVATLPQIQLSINISIKPGEEITIQKEFIGPTIIRMKTINIVLTTSSGESITVQANVES